MVFYENTSIPVEIITLAEAKFQLRVDDIVNHEDSLIQDYIIEAREIAENYISGIIAKRSILVSATGYLDTLRGPVNSIESVKYIKDGVETVVSSADYTLVGKSKLIYTLNVPTSVDGFIIEMTAGYEPSDCPKAIVSAMKLILTRLYNFREDGPQEKQSHSHNILRNYKRWV